MKKLIIFNKADLIRPEDGKRILAVMEELGKPAIMISAIEQQNVDKIRQFVMQETKVRYETVGLWLMVVGMPNVGKSTIINALKKNAISATRRLNKDFISGVKRREAATQKKPGSTLWVDYFQISKNPTIYCFDTPGIMLLKTNGMRDVERNMKLLRDNHNKPENGGYSQDFYVVISRRYVVL